MEVNFAVDKREATLAKPKLAATIIITGETSSAATIVAPTLTIEVGTVMYLNVFTPILPLKTHP